MYSSSCLFQNVLMKYLMKSLQQTKICSKMVGSYYSIITLKRCSFLKYFRAYQHWTYYKLFVDLPMFSLNHTFDKFSQIYLSDSLWSEIDGNSIFGLFWTQLKELRLGWKYEKRSDQIHFQTCSNVPIKQTIFQNHW